MVLTNDSLMILTRVPAGKEFDAAATSATESGAIVFRESGEAHVPSRLLPGQDTTADRALVAAECWLQGDIKAMISGLRSRGVETWVEVTDVSQAERAVSAGAAGIVACGLEGGGLVSDLKEFKERQREFELRVRPRRPFRKLSSTFHIRSLFL